jgi:hypothetical protein
LIRWRQKTMPYRLKTGCPQRGQQCLTN